MAYRVLGVDACRAGWVGVVLHDGEVSVHYGPTMADLVARVDGEAGLDAVGVDIPIGLPDTGPRRADLAARKLLGGRASAVFLTPVRPALLAADHVTAVRVSQQLTGSGISIQAFSLRSKILEVDAWLARQRHRVVEVHPELSFARIAGGALAERKSTWAGAERRRELLRAEGIRLEGPLGEAGRIAQVDDVLDAAAAAWSALRVARGTAQRLPDPPEQFSDGLPCAIWV